MADPADAQVTDPGIDEAADKLSRARIEEAIDQVLSKETAARLKVYLDTCVRCGLCSEACHTFVSRDGDPDHAPVAKVKRTLWEMVRRKGKMDREALKRAARIAFTDCTTCRRCSLYCPFGIDIAYLIMIVRRICNQLGVVPQLLQDAANSHASTSNLLWVQQDDWLDALMWQEEDARDELEGVRIPIDREGAEVMYTVMAIEPKILAHLLANMAQIMEAAGVDWTMPGSDGWDNSNMAMYAGDLGVMARVVRNHWENARRLRVKRVVIGECGHAIKSVTSEGPKLLGWAGSPVPLTHAVEFYWELFSSGRLKVKEKLTEPVTLQDPCNIVRGQGLHHKLRYVLGEICEDFRDMEPRFEHNYCCGGGAGVINCGPQWKLSRMKSTRVKAEQLAATGAEICVTPCHGCRSGIDDIAGHYGIKMKAAFVSDLIVKAIELPEHARWPERRI